jgi:biopolymer transport protein ExbD
MIEGDDIFRPGARRAALQTDLVPLINIVFLLLIFFLVTGSALSPNEKLLKTPLAFTGVTVQADALDVRLRADKKFEIDGELLSVAQVKDLNQFFVRIFAQDPKRQVLLSADADLSAKYLLQLIQLVSAAGGQNISIATHMVERDAGK